jgi:predicted transcriptional regulator
MPALHSHTDLERIIVREYKAGLTVKEIAEFYGKTKQQIHKILGSNVGQETHRGEPNMKMAKDIGALLGVKRGPYKK